EARHVAYGTLHLRWAVDHDPDVAEEIHVALDHGEGAMMSLGGAPDLTTAIAMLLAGGAENIEEKGFPLQMQLARNQFTSYLARCERAGVGRLDRTKLPLAELGIDIERIRAATSQGRVA